MTRVGFYDAYGHAAKWMWPRGLYAQNFFPWRFGDGAPWAVAGAPRAPPGLWGSAKIGCGSNRGVRWTYGEKTDMVKTVN